MILLSHVNNLDDVGVSQLDCGLGFFVKPLGTASLIEAKRHLGEERTVARGAFVVVCSPRYARAKVPSAR